MKLNLKSLSDPTFWNEKGIALPAYDIQEVKEATQAAPIWVHFGVGNIFRAFVAAMQQDLLNHGKAEKGIVAAEVFDPEVIGKAYAPYDMLCLKVILNANATLSQEVVASVCETVDATGDFSEMDRLKEIFCSDSLQMASFTITEKGYALWQGDGSLFPAVLADMTNGPAHAAHGMGKVAALLYERYLAGGHPIALVSMDNCSKNGEKLRTAVLGIAQAWAAAGLCESGFIEYLTDETKVSFPWSMIDKITPRPDASVTETLVKQGLEGMEPFVTEKGTYTAAFVNAEAPGYLVIEDAFPNGRPALEEAGAYMTTRDVVQMAERMKVCTCLNPLHTAMSVYGCMLGYTKICDEMKDKQIVDLIKTIGYVEGLPVVEDPGILSPKAFIDEVVEERLANPFLPDAPQRIATDTSQKVGIRFGETIKAYQAAGMDLGELKALPLAIAGWLRYLLGVDDQLAPMEVSSDPLLPMLQEDLTGVTAGDPSCYQGQAKKILANANIFGLDLTATCLGEKIETMFKELIAGPGAIRSTMKKYLGE